MNFISRNHRHFKANLHAHTTLSDGNLTPEQSVEAYSAKGYQILALTDHEAPYAHHRFTADDFLMITFTKAAANPNKELSTVKVQTPDMDGDGALDVYDIPGFLPGTTTGYNLVLPLGTTSYQFSGLFCTLSK